MLILIMMLIILILGFLVVRYIDQQRWDRYQFDRAKYFQNHPYEFQFNQSYAIYIPVPSSIQNRLINSYMLKVEDQQIYTKAKIQRMETHHVHSHQLKVSLHDIDVGYLEVNYATRFTQALKHSDFYVGRPILVEAKVSFKQVNTAKRCVIQLDLCPNPNQAHHYLKEQVVMMAQSS